MRKNLQTNFSSRQYMLARDFEIYYYNGLNRQKVGRHSHSYYEFYLFLEGNVTMEVTDAETTGAAADAEAADAGTVPVGPASAGSRRKLFPLRQGDVVLIPPGVVHRALIHNEEQPYRRFVFWISEEYCNQLLSLSPSYGYIMQQAALRNQYIFHNDVITFNAIQSRVFQLIEEIHSQRFGKEAQVSLCVNDLILHLNRIAYEQEHPKRYKEEQKLYESLIGYIEEHLGEELSLNQLAESFYLSKYHIAHVFKENTGLSLHQYITKKRLQKCREAILGSEDISKVYLLYGFADYSSFYRAFKKEYGISPKEYKEQYFFMQ